MIASVIILSILFLCWGSFLNVIAYRLIANIPFFYARSVCPNCNRVIAWYDNIPIFSYIRLKGTCRSCGTKISWLYMFIELLTFVSFWLIIWRLPVQYWFAYFIFFSALIITIRTDLETMMISRFATLLLIPIGWLFSYIKWLPLSLLYSVIGTFSAYLALSLIALCYSLITKQRGLGQGDIELLAFIGTFLGPFGWWISLLIGSLLGSGIGIGMAIIYNRSIRTIKIPFGPFLAFGALFYTFFQHTFVRFFF